ncbi:pullulanase [Metabacillus indicus]|uniref:pullulanase n=1 Tax=Metabacillus indicus TaxID=246786 RepID=UPI00068BF7A2|nr:pullulanase [Metabacillus indicus]
MTKWVKSALILVLLLGAVFPALHLPAAKAAEKDPELPENTVRIHYVKDDKNYKDLGLWLWEDVAEAPKEWPKDAVPFTDEQSDEHGRYIDVKVKEGAKKLGFLVVNRVTGEKTGGDKVFTMLEDYNHLWIKNADDTIYTSSQWENPVAIISAEITSSQKLLVGLTRTEGLTEEELVSSIKVQDEAGAEVPVQSAKITSASTVEVTVGSELNGDAYTVTYGTKSVTATRGWRMIDELYSYEGDDLGASYSGGQAVLKLWAPRASKVTAVFYDKNDASKEIGKLDLTMGDKGVWSVEAKPGDLGVSDLKGYYYQYEVTNGGETKKVLDPYAKSMAPFTVNTKGEAGPDGDLIGKAAIVDLAGTDPAGLDFAKIDGYEKKEDAVIWEIHVRDFTSDPSIEGDLSSEWGTYDAFKDKLDYIKSLGVTHVQLLPVMAWYYGDETNMRQREMEYSAANNEYNWGYDPHSYFSPDGAYSKNAADPELRIKELKGLIDAVHDAGMGVVLDVVYTHMAKASMLNDIVPNYYAFQDANGNFIGGFGNNLATNHYMAEKLMIDSVKYWFEEYKIDGMRFDMMGDATYDSIQNAYNAAAGINKDALFIGEGWRTFGGQLSDPALAGKGADQDWMNKTNDVGVFSDEIRNELKSGFGSEGEPRFLTGGARSIDLILKNIKGQPTNTPADDPGDMVQYIEAHDNLPLYDVIAQSIKKDPAVPENNQEIHDRIRLGNAMILTSQGTAFLHAGQEYGRTKQWFGEGMPEQKFHELKDENGKSFGYFIHDSYDSSDAINKFDWTKATDAGAYPINNTTRKYTAGLIELRKSTDAFRLGSKELVDSNVTMIEAPEIQASDLMIGYKAVSSDKKEEYSVFVNADSKERTLTLSEDLRKGTVVADNDEAGAEKVKKESGFKLKKDSITIEPLTAVVIKVTDEKTNGPKDPAPPAPKPNKPEKPEVKPAEPKKNEPKKPSTSEKTEDEQEAAVPAKSDNHSGGSSLPATATNHYMLILIGAAAMAAGAGSYFLIRRRAALA